MSFLKTIIGANALALAFSFAFIGDANAQYSSTGYPKPMQERQSLKNRIDFASKSGQITAAQTASLDAAIINNYNYQELTAMQDFSINLAEKQHLDADLTNIEKTLNSYIAQNLGTNTSARANDRGDWRGHWGSNRTRNGDEVNSLRTAAESKVATALASNKITAPQATSVRAMLSTNATQQASFMVDGRIDSRERDDLSKGIKAAEDSLASLISINLSNNPNGQFSFYDKSWWNRSWNSELNSSMVSRLSKLSERIERGKMSGRLTANEYSALKADLDKLSTPNQFGFRGRHSRWNKALFETAVNNLETKVRIELTDRENANRGRYF